MNRQGPIPNPVAEVPIPVAAYVRMSTEHQQYSTENQLDRVKEYAARHGMAIVKQFADEGKSGLSIRGRDSLRRMIEEVENGFATFRCILVYDVSRWGRFQDADESGYYEYICKRAGIDVHYCAEQFVNDGSPTSNIIKSVKRSMAGEYSRELSTKVFQGACRLIQLGFKQGGAAGFGLRRMLVDQTGNHKSVLRVGEQKSLQTDRVIEKDVDAFACLDATLRANGYGDRIGKTIHLHRKRFENVAPAIIEDINTRHKKKGNRTIFFLDQCGWTEISAATIADISKKLHHRPEFIVNFAITWLTDFISDKTLESKVRSLRGLGLEGFVDIEAMMKLRLELGGRWEHAVEAHIGKGFHAATGIPHYSPFYIEPYGNHRGYWLLHLAGSARARSAMTEIHWSKANRSKHYGYHGYDMLSYKPDHDKTEFIEGSSFDDQARKRCGEALAGDLPRIIRDGHKDGIPYKSFLDSITNKIMATSPMVQEVVWQICESKDFEVICPSGKPKRSSNLADDDVIRPRKQFFLPGVEMPTAKTRMAAVAPSVTK